MNSAPACSPVSDDGDFDGELSPGCFDDVDNSLQADGSVVTGHVSVSGDCEKAADSDSDDGPVDDDPVHRLIVHCQQTGSTAVDLSRHCLQSLSRKLLKLSHLQVTSLSIIIIIIIIFFNTKLTNATIQ